MQPEESIPLADIEAAIRVVEWFKVQDRRVYARMAASEADAKIEDVTDLIKATGGRLSVRDLLRSRHRSRTNRDMAQEVLDRIVERGEARWQEEPNPRGGRRRRYVELVDPAPDCRI